MRCNHLIWHLEEPCVVVEANIKCDGMDLLATLLLEELDNLMAPSACCVHHKLGRQFLPRGQTDSCRRVNSGQMRERTDLKSKQDTCRLALIAGVFANEDNWKVQATSALPPPVELDECSLVVIRHPFTFVGAQVKESAIMGNPCRCTCTICHGESSNHWAIITMLKS